jgi:hypothetical protein
MKLHQITDKQSSYIRQHLITIFHFTIAKLIIYFLNCSFEENSKCMFIFAGERPHRCDICGKGFTQIKCTTLLKFEIWHSATCYDFCQINPNRLGVNIILQYAETWRTIVLLSSCLLIKVSKVVSIEGRSQRTHRLCIHQKCVTLTQTSTVELARNQNRWYVYTNALR